MFGGFTGNVILGHIGLWMSPQAASRRILNKIFEKKLPKCLVVSKNCHTFAPQTNSGAHNIKKQTEIMTKITILTEVNYKDKRVDNWCYTNEPQAKKTMKKFIKEAIKGEEGLSISKDGLSARYVTDDYDFEWKIETFGIL